MKITNFFIAIIVSLLLFSCEAKPEAKLYGTWKNTEVKITKKDGSEVAPERVESRDHLIQTILSDETTYEFSAGEDEGKYTLTTREGSKSGSFQAIDLADKTEIILFDEDVTLLPTQFTADELTETKMVTSVVNTGMKMTSTYTKQ